MSTVLPFDYFDRAMKAGDVATNARRIDIAAIEAANLADYRNRELDLRRHELALMAYLDNRKLDQTTPGALDNLNAGLRPVTTFVSIVDTILEWAR